MPLPNFFPLFREEAPPMETLNTWESPLAQKRIILFSIRKQMIGRRSYSDTIHAKRRGKLAPKDRDEEGSTSSRGSPAQSPKENPQTPTQADIEARAFEITAC
jgi:hypothetical protein